MVEVDEPIRRALPLVGERERAALVSLGQPAREGRGDAHPVHLLQLLAQRLLRDLEVHEQADERCVGRKNAGSGREQGEREWARRTERDGRQRDVHVKQPAPGRVLAERAADRRACVVRGSKGVQLRSCERSPARKGARKEEQDRPRAEAMAQVAPR